MSSSKATCSLLLPLPADLISAITRLLSVREVLRLARLCGNTAIWKKFTRVGAITELYFEEQDASDRARTSLRPFLLNASLLPTFTSLTRLSIVSRIIFPTIWPLVQQLPPTMRKIELDAYFATDVLLRPFNDLIDPHDLYPFCTNNRLLPIALDSLFPELHSLTILTESPEFRTVGTQWPSSAVHYFITRLPTSLTSLHVSADEWSPMLYPGRSLQAAKFAATLSRLHVRVNQEEELFPLFCASTASRKTDITATASPDALILGNLTSLKNVRISCAASVEALTYLKCLKHLGVALYYDYGPKELLPFPSTLETLEIECTKGPFRQLGRLHHSLPKLRELRFITHSGQSDFQSMQLPQQLEVFEVRYMREMVNVVSFTPLPRLRELLLPQVCLVNTKINNFPNLTYISVNDIGQIKLDDTESPMRKLQVARPIGLSRLVLEKRLLCPSLELYKSTIVINGDSISTWTASTRERLQELFFKICDISTAKLDRIVKRFLKHYNFTLSDCTVTIAAEVMAALAKDKSKWQKMRILDLLKYPNASLPPRCFPPHLTSLSTVLERNTWHFMLSDLPPTLTRLCIQNTHRVLLPGHLPLNSAGTHQVHPAIFKDPTDTDINLPEKMMTEYDVGATMRASFDFKSASKSPDWTLPPGVTSLEIRSPCFVRMSSSKRDGVLFPLLGSASQLTRLHLFGIHDMTENYNFVPYLPNTITDLELGFNLHPVRARRVLIALSVPQNWLPLLRRLRVTNACFPLLAIAERLDSFDSLYLDDVMVAESLIQTFDSENKAQLDSISYADVHQLLLLRFPPRFRHPTIAFYVEWGRSVVSKLPNTLKTLTIDHPYRSSPAGHFIKYLPRSLTVLNLNGYGHTEIPNMEELPPGLTSLSVKLLKFSFSNLRNLPRSLTHLQLQLFTKKPLTISHFEALPRGLTSLWLKLHCSALLDLSVFSGLPHGLLDLRLDVACSYYASIIQYLPKSLVSCHLDTYLQAPLQQDENDTLAATVASLLPAVTRFSIA